MKSETKSKVMTLANSLVSQGFNRPNAMLKAWVLVRLSVIETKVYGVTFGKRQQALEHLARYNKQDISIALVREYGNKQDINAVAVVASVKGKGSYIVGYLPRALSSFIAPLINAGKHIQGTFKEIRGLYHPFMNYGLRIEVRV